MAQNDIVYEDFVCPKENGFFPHEYQCDAYYSCEDGVPEFRLCGNGLAFDDTNDQFEDCNYIFAIDCGNRTELGRPSPSSRMAEGQSTRRASLLVPLTFVLHVISVVMIAIRVSLHVLSTKKTHNT